MFWDYIYMSMIVEPNAFDSSSLNHSLLWNGWNADSLLLFAMFPSFPSPLIKIFFPVQDSPSCVKNNKKRMVIIALIFIVPLNQAIQSQRSPPTKLRRCMFKSTNLLW